MKLFIVSWDCSSVAIKAEDEKHIIEILSETHNDEDLGFYYDEIDGVGKVKYKYDDEIEDDVCEVEEIDLTTSGIIIGSYH